MKGEISGKHITAIPQSLLYSKVCWASGLLLLLPKLAKKKPVNHLFCSTLLLFCSLIFFLALECMVSPPSSLRPIGSLPVLWQHAACTSNPHGTAAPLLYERCEKIRTLAGPLSLVPYFFNSTRDPLQYGKCGCQYGMHGCLVCEVGDSIPQNLSYSHGISLLKIQPLGVLRFSPCTIHDLLQKYN